MELAQSQLEGALTGAVFAPIHNVGWIRVTGEDRVRWLNGMVTNSIQALKSGEGCYNFFLNAQGRIQGDCIAWMLDDSILLQTSDAGRLITMLDHFIIMDDVELGVAGLSERDLSLPHDGRHQSEAPQSGLLLAGPRAAALLAELDLPEPDPMQRVRTVWQTTVLDVSHVHSPLVSRFELWSDPATLGVLSETLRHAGASESSGGTFEQLRLLEGTPLYGVDIRDKELPQETNQTRALHFSKGCYLGQEIVERIRSRGQVNRLLTPLTLTGEVPTVGTALTANDKPVGEITSAAEVPGYGILALGYVRREALGTHASLAYSGGTAAVRTVNGSQ